MSVQIRPESTVAEPKVVEGLVCDTSVSEFDPRQSPQLETAAEGQLRWTRRVGQKIYRE
jgi:hypothetical protein